MSPTQSFTNTEPLPRLRGPPGVYSTFRGTIRHEHTPMRGFSINPLTGFGAGRLSDEGDTVFTNTVQYDFSNLGPEDRFPFTGCLQKMILDTELSCASCRNGVPSIHNVTCRPQVDFKSDNALMMCHGCGDLQRAPSWITASGLSQDVTYREAVRSLSPGDCQECGEESYWTLLTNVHAPPSSSGVDGTGSQTHTEKKHGSSNEDETYGTAGDTEVRNNDGETAEQASSKAWKPSPCLPPIGCDFFTSSLNDSDPLS
ncbi:uncharacterized protein L199_007376 [Kwoniella botswanensis]|uniref:uncharacterized protein n=1 Tax=Kwoniella botswanensis TaxID=1268659 RepID=UPI00315CEDC3